MNNEIVYEYSLCDGYYGVVYKTPECYDTYHVTSMGNESYMGSFDDLEDAKEFVKTFN
jgi:hypothetical protein